MGWQAFTPSGNTVSIAATGTASTAVQVPSRSGQSAGYLISNGSTGGVLLAWGGNSATTAAGVVATVTLPAQEVWIPGNSVQAFTFGPQTWFSAITLTGESTLYITPGDGI